MVDWLWLSNLLVLASVARLSFSLQFFPDSDFDGRPATETEADAFFKKVDERVRKRNLRGKINFHSIIT